MLRFRRATVPSSTLSQCFDDLFFKVSNDQLRTHDIMLSLSISHRKGYVIGQADATSQWNVVRRVFGAMSPARVSAGPSVPTCVRHRPHEVESAAAHRASVHLNRASWLKARAAALQIHQVTPSASLVAALAAFQLGSMVEARVLFLHAVLNAPRTVAMVLGVKGLEPSTTSHYEVSDHNGGIALRYSLSGYLANQRAAAKQFFAAQWKDEQLAKLRAQLEQASHRWDADRTGADKQAFDTMTRMRRFDFALEMLGTPELKARPQRRRALH